MYKYIYILLILICVTKQNLNTLKQGSKIDFKLNSSQEETINFQLQGPYIGFYLRPISDDKNLKEKIERKHQNNLGAADEEDDGNDRILSQASTSGVIDFKINNIKVQLDQFYRTAVFLNDDVGQTNKLQLSCIHGPCSGSITAYNLKDDDELVQKEQNQIHVSSQDPVRGFKISVPQPSDQLNRIVLSVRCEGEFIEASNLALQLVGGKTAIRSANRLYMVIQGSDLIKNKIMYFAVSADNPRQRQTLYIQYEMFNNETRLEKDREIIDYLLVTNYYVLKISNKYETFGLTLTNLNKQSGLPRIYANIDQRPQKLTDYRFDSTIETGEQVTMLFRNQELDGEYLYISIHQSSKSNQGLIRLIYNKSTNDPILVLDKTYMSQLIPGAIHTYLLKSFNSGNEEQNNLYIKVEAKQLQLETDIDNINIYVKQCDKAFCNGQQYKTGDALKNYDSDIFHFHQNKPIVNIKPKCDQYSQQDADGYCWFELAVQSGGDQDLHYSIDSMINEGNIVLSENQPFSSEIIEGDTHQYLYFYENDKDDDVSLTFSVSNDNVAFMIATSKRCNPINSNCAKYFGSYNQPIILRGDQLYDRAFYIGVEGLDATQYTITIELQKSTAQSVLRLKEGQSHKGILHPGQKYGDLAYFQFSVDFSSESQDSLPSIEINLQASHYKLALVVNEGNKLASTKQFDLVSLNGYIVINPKDNMYRIKGNYSIGVEFLYHDGVYQVDIDTNVPYIITFATSKTLRHFPLNHIIKDSLQPNKQKSYFFLYDPYSTKPLILTKSQMVPMDQTLRFFLTSEIDSEVSDEYQIEVIQQNNASSSYMMNGGVLSKLCGLISQNDTDDGKDDWICEIYLIVENKNENQVQYSLTLWNTDESIEVLEGVMLKYNLESIEENNSIMFQYHPVSYVHDLQIIVQSFYGDLLLNIKLSDCSKNITTQIIEYNSSAHNTHSKTIKPKLFEQCQPNCIVFIQVRSAETLKQFVGRPQDQDREIRFDDTFSIVLSQRFLQLELGQVIEFAVSQGQPRYFLFSGISDFIQSRDGNNNNNTIIISIQEILGRASMCISLNDDESLKMPLYDDRSSCDFHIVGNRLELDRTKITELIKQQNLSMNNNPVLIIEIQSYVTPNSIISSTAKVELLIDLSNAPIKQLLLGNPMRIQLGDSQDTELQYFHYLEEDVEIKITRLSGYGWLGIVIVSEDNKEQVYLDKLFLTGQSQNSIIISQDSEMYCVFCTYKLKFNTGISISLLALVTVTTSSQYVRLNQGLTYTDSLNIKNKFNIYRVAIDVDKQTEVVLHLYNGNPLLKMGFVASLNENQYELGPYDVQKFSQQLNLTDQPGFFEAIAPPRSHLSKNSNQYNISLGFDNNLFADHFVEDDLYLFIRSQSDQLVCNYTITVTQSTNGAPNVLEDGLIQQIVLNRMRPRATLLYYHLNDQGPMLLIRKSSASQINFDHDLNITAKLATADDHTKTNYSDMIDVQLQLYTMHTDQAAYTFPKQTGLYEISIVNLLAKHDIEESDIAFSKSGIINTNNFREVIYRFQNNYLDRMELSVAINSQDTFLIEKDSWYQGVVQPNSHNFYELSIPKDGSLGISLQNCGSGQLILSYTQSYQQYLEMKWDSSSRSISGSSLDQLINVHSGVIYISIQSNSDLESIYIISNQQGIDPLPHGRLIAGGEGELEYQIHQEDPDKINIIFKPLKCFNCDLNVLEKSQILYEIVWSNNEKYLNSLGKCGAQQFRTQSIQNAQSYGNLKYQIQTLVPIEPITIEIDVDKQSDSDGLYVSVRAQVQTFAANPVQNYALLYQNMHINLPKNALYFYKHRREQFAIGISLLLGFVLAIKTRKLQKVQLELDLERKMNQAKKGQQIEVQLSEGKYGQLEDECDQSQIQIQESEQVQS